MKSGKAASRTHGTPAAAGRQGATARGVEDRRAGGERLERLQEAAWASGPVQRIARLQAAVSASPTPGPTRRSAVGAARSGGTAVVQRKEVDELVHALGVALPGEARLSKDEIVEGLRRLDVDDRGDPNFARALVEFVKGRNGSEFDITDLAEAPDPKFGRKHLNKRWTFRHYTNERHASIQSLAELEAQGIDASKNTNARDWEELGNQGYVFGLVSVDGKVPRRTWLGTMKYYAEYDIRDLPSIWVSADMLESEGREKGSFQGSGEAVIAQLSKMLGFMEQNEAEDIDAKFAGKLEAKVPPALLGEPVWRDNR